MVQGLVGVQGMGRQGVVGPRVGGYEGGGVQEGWMGGWVVESMGGLQSSYYHPQIQ